MNNLYIVIPAYNEAENIINVINEWYPIVSEISFDSKLVIINDGSTDNTFGIANSMTNNRPQLIVLNKVNSGHGSSCLYGYRYAIKAGAEFVFQTDSDRQTLPDEFWQFWNVRNDYNFIIGNRQSRQDGLSRRLVTKVLKLVIRSIFGIIVQDANTPYRLMKTANLKTYIDVIPKDFFLSNVLLTTLSVKRGESVKWFDITFRPRQAGENTINIKRIVQIGYKAVYSFREFLKANEAFTNSKADHN
ncbi:MAG: glycosyl transferase family 2 [Firmicutes bacterium]|nr:glycosyl transferase family 2 [Bacillota bacterium]